MRQRGIIFITVTIVLIGLLIISGMPYFDFNLIHTDYSDSQQTSLDGNDNSWHTPSDQNGSIPDNNPNSNDSSSNSTSTWKYVNYIFNL